MDGRGAGTHDRAGAGGRHGFDDMIRARHFAERRKPMAHVALFTPANGVGP
jgi:hypothetical protein